MAVDRSGRDAAGGDQVAGTEIFGHVGLELVGRVAVTVADNEFVSDVQLGTTATGQFDSGVLSDRFDTGQDQVASQRGDRSGKQLGGVGQIDPACIVGRLSLHEAIAGQRQPGSGFRISEDVDDVHCCDLRQSVVLGVEIIMRNVTSRPLRSK